MTKVTKLLTYYQFNQQTPAASAFLRGVTFTVLALLVQNPDKIKLGEYLIPLAAIIGFIFILIALASMKNYPDDPEKGVVSSYFHFVTFLFTVGIVGIMLLIAGLVYQYSQYMAIGVFIAETVLMVTWAFLDKKNPPKE